MKIVFMSNSDFGLPSLEVLVKKRRDELLIVSSLPKKKGRGRKFFSSPFPQIAEQWGIEFYAIEDIHSREVQERLLLYSPDLFITVSFGFILPSSLLSIPHICALNIHPSLLPKYRGPAPINWALIRGEDKTGITIMRMAETVDSGEIILQKEIKIDGQDDAISLFNRLSRESAGLLLRVLARLSIGDIRYTPQEGGASYAPKLRKCDGIIKWNKDSREIFNLIRGVQGWPGAQARLRSSNGVISCLLYKVEIIDEERIGLCGEVLDISGAGISVQCARGTILISEIQPLSQRKMSARDFVNGYRIKRGDRFL